MRVGLEGPPCGPDQSDRSDQDSSVIFDQEPSLLLWSSRPLDSRALRRASI